MSKKKKIIISIVAFVLITGGVSISVVFLVNRHNALQYESYVSAARQTINDWEYNFNSTIDHGRRVELYNGLSDVHIEYINRNSKSNDVVSMFESSLITMQEDFFDYYYTKIEKVEEVELPEQIIDIISVLEDNINELISIKTEISNDGVFVNETSKINQLNDKADTSINLFTETKAWLIKVVELSEKFLDEDRDGKFVVFNDVLSLQKDFDTDGFESDFVSTELNALVAETREWFYEWYINELALRYSDQINTLIHLNNLADLIAMEGEILFTTADVNMLTSSFDDAYINSLSVLENNGIRRINNYNFHSEATDQAIEHFVELFTVWRGSYNDNDHLLTFDEILNEAIDIGQARHDTEIRAEAERKTRIGFT